MIKTTVQRWLRAMGLEASKFKNANVEPQLVRQLLRLTNPTVVIDVGANIGQFGDLVLAAGFGGTLVSFEAIPEVHRKLVARAKGSKRPWIVAPCVALGSGRGHATINISANSVSSSILPMLEAHLEASPQSRYVAQQTIPIERLDQLAPGIIPPEGEMLLKVDTQGYEMEVLKGASGLLARTVAIQLELSLVRLYEGAPTFVDMISFVQANGYEIFGLVPEFRDRATGRLLQVDGFFVRSDRMVGNRPRGIGYTTRNVTKSSGILSQ